PSTTDITHLPTSYSQEPNQIIIPQASVSSELAPFLQGIYELNQNLVEQLRKPNPPPSSSSFVLYFFLLLALFLASGIFGYHYLFRELLFHQELTKTQLENSLKKQLNQDFLQPSNSFPQNETAFKAIEEQQNILKISLQGTQDELNKLHQLNEDSQKKLEEKEKKIDELHQIQQTLTQNFAKEFTLKEEELRALKTVQKQIEEQMKQLQNLAIRQQEEIQKLQKQIPQLSSEDLKRLKTLDEEFDGELKKIKKEK
ncbi:MAG: hypothetical protein AABZ60_14525, partial [Planctomycetota bacterium]